MARASELLALLAGHERVGRARWASWLSGGRRRTLLGAGDVRGAAGADGCGLEGALGDQALGSECSMHRKDALRALAFR